MSTIKQLVDETTNIKNKLVTCHSNLKNNLTKKGVECSDSDKLLSLINKVGNIGTGKKWAMGEATTGTSSYSFNLISGASSNFTYFNITNLGFVPSTIIYISKTNGNGFGILSNLSYNYSNSAPKFIQFSNIYSNGGSTPTVYGIKADARVFVNNSTIQLPSNWQKVTYSWIAFE